MLLDALIFTCWLFVGALVAIMAWGIFEATCELLIFRPVRKAYEWIEMELEFPTAQLTKAEPGDEIAEAVPVTIADF